MRASYWINTEGRARGFVAGALALGGCTELADSTDSAVGTMVDSSGLAGLAGGRVDAGGRLDAGGASSRADDGDEPGARTSPQLGADWSCLSEPDQSLGGGDEQGDVEYRVRFTDILGGPTPENIQVRACLQIDLNCGGNMPVDADQDGVATLRLESGFSGYLEILADGIVPVRFYPLTVRADTTYQGGFRLATVVALAPLAQASQTTFDAALAHLNVEVRDCALERASGVVLNNDLGGLGYYFADGIPTSAAEATDARGGGGFFNLPVPVSELRNVNVWGERQDTRERVGERTVTLRSGWFTTVQLAPR